MPTIRDIPIVEEVEFILLATPFGNHGHLSWRVSELIIRYGFMLAGLGEGLVSQDFALVWILPGSMGNPASQNIYKSYLMTGGMK